MQNYRSQNQQTNYRTTFALIHLHYVFAFSDNRIKHSPAYIFHLAIYYLILSYIRYNFTLDDNSFQEFQQRNYQSLTDMLR